ncbi:MAG: C25 family cysteine peptidase [Bacteroidales bacterium]
MISRITSILILSCMIFSSDVAAGMLEKSYSHENYSLTYKNNFTTLQFESSFQSGKPGEPALPYFQVSLLLQQGEMAESIEFSGSELTEIPGEYIIYPRQYDRPLDEEKDKGINDLLINEKLYRKDINLPSVHTGHLSTQYFHGYPLAICTYTPVIYNPGQKKLWYYKKITLKIHTVTATAKDRPSPLSANPESRSRVQTLIQNPENLLDYPPVISDTTDYQVLIVSPESFTGSFSSLVDHYYSRGMKSKIISTTTINGTFTGQDLQEKIRNCIIGEYIENNIEHVLLAGDAELIPARGFYAQVQSSSVYTDYNIPSDIYYAALDGNWNTDGDDKWAEPGEDDLYPELSVGRFAVSTVAELNNIINKTIHYQNYPVTSECRKPLMVGEHLYNNPLTWGGDYLDLLTGLHSDNGYTTQGIPEWHNIQKLYDRDLPSPWTLNDFLAEINAGTSFLHHCGHSNTNYLMRMYSSSVTEANFSMVNGIDHNFIPVYSHGCYCAAFDASDCIAEVMLNLSKFAVAFVGNSRYGWFNEGTTEGPSIHLHREFVNALYGESLGQIGSAHTLSKVNTAPWVTAPGQWEEGALRWCFYDCNILGDPAMFIWTETPMNLTVTYPDSIAVSTASFLVECDTLDNPVGGLSCAVFKDSLHLITAFTDSLGHALIPLTLTSTDTGLLTLIVSGFNCLPDTSFIRIMPLATIFGTVIYDNANQTPLDSVVVYLIQAGDTLAEAQTGSNGEFLFSQINEGAYQITGRCYKSWGGVNSSDALMIMRHFVHIITLNGIAKKAADVDHNNIANALDAYSVQGRFVGILSGFPGGDWVFEEKTIQVGIAGQHDVTLKGLCMGDVNRSFVPE